MTQPKRNPYLGFNPNFSEAYRANRAEDLKLNGMIACVFAAAIAVGVYGLTDEYNSLLGSTASEAKHGLATADMLPTFITKDEDSNGNFADVQRAVHADMSQLGCQIKFDC